MASSDFQTKCLSLVVIASVLAASPAFADKPSWAGNHPGAQNLQDEHRPDRRYYPDRGQRDRDYDRRDWSGDSRYRDRRDGEHADRRYDRRYEDRNPQRYSGGRYFGDQQRTIVYNYYYDEYRGGGRCPPGLAKKHNGCMPPGQARRWAIGRPLPRNVIFYDVPAPVVMGLGYPPPGYRFVRVASDILMIAIGTGLVMDAIYDLGGGW
ncbi:hypothetical protein [Methylomicrobium sp. Wu6]|uniref:hypothetical protein n=1 Tax=Methylomicrobium sp. Wu6 TaxID=3107928 RepID=UPI002DD6AED2|nr:hypothetical protein [Methylomicrobium sp. Wu6]MEC4747426.1 hypothetical protein [Methylomicrobium sp. Wu6]